MTIPEMDHSVFFRPEILSRITAGGIDHAFALEYQRVMGDPILREYQRTMRYRPENLIHTPMEALGERLSWAAALLLRHDEVLGWDGIGRMFLDHGLTEKVDIAKAIALAIVRMSLSAVPVLWSKAMMHTAQDSKVPPHVISNDLLPFPLMWWTYEEGIEANLPEYGPILIDAFLMMAAGDGFIGIILGSNGDGTTLYVYPGWYPYSQRYPDDFPEPEKMGKFLAMFSFMQSKYVSSDDQVPSRAERRNIQRVDQNYVIPSVKVIRLRAKEDAGMRVEGASRGQAREWDHRWLVRGHHRAQWYPSKGTHKVIWVPAYVKGPADKEFRPPVYSVTR